MGLGSYHRVLCLVQNMQTLGQLFEPLYLSQSFSSTKRNYNIYDRELLTIIQALKSWRQYLHGSPFPIQVFTDHKNLTYFHKAQSLNQRQASWNRNSHWDFSGWSLNWQRWWGCGAVVVVVWHQHSFPISILMATNATPWAGYMNLDNVPALWKANAKPTLLLSKLLLSDQAQETLQLHLDTVGPDVWHWTNSSRRSLQ